MVENFESRKNKRIRALVSIAIHYNEADQGQPLDYGFRKM